MHWNYDIYMYTVTETNIVDWMVKERRNFVDVLTPFYKILLYLPMYMLKFCPCQHKGKV